MPSTRPLVLDRQGPIIGGVEAEGTDAFLDIDPSTELVLAEVVAAGPELIDQAVEAARRAFETTWRRTLAAERGSILRRISQLILESKDDLAQLESLDTGKPLRQARVDVEVAARYFEFYGSIVEALHGDTLPLLRGISAFTLREPFGVTAHIIPWNYPIQIASRTAAPALAAGNCCVIKPAEEAPLSVLRLARIALEAGLPAGVLNVVPGIGDVAGATLARHPGIDHLSFVGSVEVGRSVATSAAQNVVPTTLELGGKSPNIVFSDANLDAATPVIVNSVIQNAGQTCSAGSRILVQEAVRDSLLEAVLAKFASVQIGAGPDDPDLGPLISARQRDRVLALVERGKQEAKLVTGGTPPEGAELGRGFYFLPTLFEDEQGKAVISQEEVFGPVVSLIPFRTERDAVALANGTPYGLIAAVWTTDVGRAHALARELRAGQVYVNAYGAGGGVELPFGGYGLSGYGREKGVEGLLAMTQTKTVAIRVPDIEAAVGEVTGR